MFVFLFCLVCSLDEKYLKNDALACARNSVLLFFSIQFLSNLRFSSFFFSRPSDQFPNSGFSADFFSLFFLSFSLLTCLVVVVVVVVSVVLIFSLSLSLTLSLPGVVPFSSGYTRIRFSLFFSFCLDAKFEKCFLPLPLSIFHRHLWAFFCLYTPLALEGSSSSRTRRRLRKTKGGKPMIYLNVRERQL